MGRGWVGFGLGLGGVGVVLELGWGWVVVGLVEGGSPSKC